MSELVEQHAAQTLATLPRALDRYVADCLDGLGWEQALQRGVRVDGRAVEDPGALVFPATDRVEVGGARLPAAAPPRRRSRVVAYHKPSKMATDVGEEFGSKMRAAVASFGGDKLMPVGQLDVMTTGLLLFTDDGELSRLLCAPGRAAKVYRVGFDAPRDARLPTPDQVDALTTPAPLGVNRAERNAARRSHEAAAPLSVKFDAVVAAGSYDIGDDTRPPGCAAKSRHHVDVTLSSGANHVIKRLFMQRCGLAVRTLSRTSVGPADLAGIPREGDWRDLGRFEVDALWAAVGGLEALADFKRAHLTCRRRSTGDARLEAFLGADDGRLRCFHQFPGLHCRHDDGSPDRRDAPGAPPRHRGLPPRSLSRTASGFLPNADQVGVFADDDDSTDDDDGLAPARVNPPARPLGRSLSKTSSGLLPTASQVFDDERSMARTLSKTSSGLLKTASQVFDDDRSMARSLSKTSSGLLRSVDEAAREDFGRLSKVENVLDRVEEAKPAALEVSGKCPVCTEAWDASEPRSTLPCCGKVICGDCASFFAMMGAKAECPVCRKPKPTMTPSRPPQ
jgi:pseudouridine synthase